MARRGLSKALALALVAVSFTTRPVAAADVGESKSCGGTAPLELYCDMTLSLPAGTPYVLWVTGDLAFTNSFADAIKVWGEAGSTNLGSLNCDAPIPVCIASPYRWGCPLRCSSTLADLTGRTVRLIASVSPGSAGPWRVGIDYDSTPGAYADEGIYVAPGDATSECTDGTSLPVFGDMHGDVGGACRIEVSEGTQTTIRLHDTRNPAGASGRYAFENLRGGVVARGDICDGKVSVGAVAGSSYVSVGSRSTSFGAHACSSTNVSPYAVVTVLGIPGAAYTPQRSLTARYVGTRSTVDLVCWPDLDPGEVPAIGGVTVCLRGPDRRASIQVADAVGDPVFARASFRFLGLCICSPAPPSRSWDFCGSTTVTFPTVSSPYDMSQFALTIVPGDRASVRPSWCDDPTTGLIQTSIS